MGGSERNGVGVETGEVRNKSYDYLGGEKGNWKDVQERKEGAKGRRREAGLGKKGSGRDGTIDWHHNRRGNPLLFLLDPFFSLGFLSLR